MQKFYIFSKLLSEIFTRVYFKMSLLISGLTDIDECQNSNGHCAHLCTNLDGGFACSCQPGYQLQADRKSCTGTFYCLSSLFGLQMHTCYL